MATEEQEDQVDFLHPQYEEFADYWARCRTVVRGSDAVKAEGQYILPALSGQDPIKYSNYKRRSLFYEASGRTVQGMLGALCGKEPILEIPPSRDDFFDTIVPAMTPIKSFIKKIAEEVITVGRCGLLIDPPSDGGDPYLSFREAESIINWHTRIIQGKEVLTTVVLREENIVAAKFATYVSVQYRVLFLDGLSGQYTQEIYVEKEDAARGDKDRFTIQETIIPTKNGQPLGFIPFYFINANGTTPEVSLPPIIGLVNVNISHYLSSADLEHARHFCALPIVYMTGFTDETEEQAPLYIGSETAWVTTNPNAKVGYLEFTGQGVQPLENALKSKEDLMVILGANLLAPPKAASESAENQRMKRSGENNILSNIADSISEGLTKAVRDLAEWRIITGFENISININKEYMQAEPDASLLTALTALLQSGAMSWDTFHYNLNKQGLIPDGTSAEDEREAINEGEYARPVVSVPTSEGPGAADDDGPDEPASTNEESEQTNLEPDQS